jgi:hypothetical protein
MPGAWGAKSISELDVRAACEHERQQRRDSHGNPLG